MFGTNSRCLTHPARANLPDLSTALGVFGTNSQCLTHPARANLPDFTTACIVLAPQEFTQNGKTWVRVTVVGQVQHELAVSLALHRTSSGRTRLFSVAELHAEQACGEWPLSDTDCWSALGYSHGASKRKRKLCAQDISKTWWAGHETHLKKAAKHEYNQERMKKARKEIAAMQ